MADENLFGKPQKVIMKKLRGRTDQSRMEPEDVMTAIDKLFPQLPPVAVSSLDLRVENIYHLSVLKKWIQP